MCLLVIGFILIYGLICQFIADRWRDAKRAKTKRALERRYVELKQIPPNEQTPEWETEMRNVTRKLLHGQY